MKDHEKDPLLAEAIARRDESRAQVLQARANRAGGTAMDRLAKAFDKMAQEAEKEARASSEALSGAEPHRPDPQGTARPLADSEGNFAANAEVAAVGGTGIDASNTDVKTGKPATSAEQAGVEAQPSAQKIVGDEAVSSTDTGKARKDK